MIEEKKSTSIKYLSVEGIEFMYGEFRGKLLKIDEILPEYSLVEQEQIKNLVSLPQSTYYGEEQYPTLESKAAIIFYKINKGHIFPNGNKRMSVYCLLVFLGINEKILDVTPNELTQKALDLAQSNPHDFENIKKEIEEWIRLKIRNLDDILT